jgi:hypothetical protein
MPRRSQKIVGDAPVPDVDLVERIERLEFGLGQRPSGSGNKPVPDPTTLTNELVAKAVAALREVVEVRLDAIDDRAKVSEENVRRHINVAIDSLKESISVFKLAVDGRFVLGADQTDKAARDVKSAVDAAFAAAKEAVGEQNKSNALSIAKSEAATAKQIDQLAENVRLSDKSAGDKIEALRKTSDDKFADLKDRVVAMESRSAVADPATTLALQKLADTTTGLRSGADMGVGGRAQADARTAWIFAAIASVAAIALVIVDSINAFRPH